MPHADLGMISSDFCIEVADLCGFGVHFVLNWSKESLGSQIYTQLTINSKSSVIIERFNVHIPHPTTGEENWDPDFLLKNSPPLLGTYLE